MPNATIARPARDTVIRTASCANCGGVLYRGKFYGPEWIHDEGNSECRESDIKDYRESRNDT